MLNSLSGKFDPIEIRTHSKFSDDKNKAKEVLAEIFNSYDLIEPFNQCPSLWNKFMCRKSAKS